MQKRCEVQFADSAEQDLDAIVAWYDGQLVPEVGQRLVAAVIEHVEQLEVFPESGTVTPEFDNPLLRELHLPPFRIVYRIEGADLVSIVRVWRSERLMDPALRGNA
jgi:plasmid stabilization system protein ParE